jgi:catecholate siderophore receptor
LGARFDSYGIDYRSNGLATATVLRNTSSFWNGQASLLWKPVDPLSLYVSWATSSNPSGEQLDGSGNAYGGISVQTANLQPERNKSWEAGVKYEANGGDLLLTAAAFSITKDNAREQIADGTYLLVGKLRSRGFELGVSGELWDKLQLFGGYTYTDARIVESLATPANVGQRFPNIPAHSANLLATWNFTKTLELGGQVHWQSAVYGGGVVAGTAHFPGYARFDLVGRAKITDRIEARLNINNLTNKLYYDAIYRSAAPFAYVAPGRSAMLSVKFSL